MGQGVEPLLAMYSSAAGICRYYTHPDEYSLKVYINMFWSHLLYAVCCVETKRKPRWIILILFNWVFYILFYQKIKWNSLIKVGVFRLNSTFEATTYAYLLLLLLYAPLKSPSERLLSHRRRRSYRFAFFFLFHPVLLYNATLHFYIFFRVSKYLHI